MQPQDMQWRGSPLRGRLVPAGPAPCRHLAARVIERALKDVLQPGQTATDRQTARRFLAGSAMLNFWCEIAGLDAGEVARVAAGLTGAACNGAAAPEGWRPRRSGRVHE